MILRLYLGREDDGAGAARGAGGGDGMLMRGAGIYAGRDGGAVRCTCGILRGGVEAPRAGCGVYVVPGRGCAGRTACCAPAFAGGVYAGWPCTVPPVAAGTGSIGR